MAFRAEALIMQTHSTKCIAINLPHVLTFYVCTCSPDNITLVTGAYGKDRNGKRKRKRKTETETETENGNGKLVMKWKRLHVVSCNNARASYSMHYIALASSVYSLDRTARQDSLKLQPFPCRTS